VPTVISDLSLELRTVLSQILNEDVPSNDTDLIETGMLDSLALVSLIMELETSFEIDIDFDDLELESFRSIDSMAAYIKSLKD